MTASHGQAPAWQRTTGARLRSVIARSLIDNFEGAVDHDMRFGLVHVGFDTLARAPKASWHSLARALRRGA